jgi:hypothetical protein
MSTGSKKGVPEQPPVGPAVQVQSLWQGRIVTTADVVHKGGQLPGMAGRVFLFGPDLGPENEAGSGRGHPVKGKGKLLVDLYEATPNAQPRLLEHYEFPNDVLNRLLRKDGIGWGYTVFLPWPEYRPETKRVQVRVSFEPDEGGALFAPPAQITLRNDSGPPVAPVVTERVMPVNAQDPSHVGAQIPMRISLEKQ